ncbi:MAG: hypothetical protein U0031_15960 [Thermomicrobiales bacterium]
MAEHVDRDQAADIGWRYAWALAGGLIALLLVGLIAIVLIAARNG